MLKCDTSMKTTMLSYLWILKVTVQLIFMGRMVSMKRYSQSSRLRSFMGATGEIRETDLGMGNGAPGRMTGDLSEDHHRCTNRSLSNRYPIGVLN
jgi:hypothetical protein